MKIIDISDQYLITASSEPEIFKISNYTPGNFEEVLAELEDFDPKQDKIFLPKEVKTEKIEIYLKDIHPFAYELSPFDGDYKKITRAIISISPMKNEKDINHPYFDTIYNWSLANYPELTSSYYNEEIINGIFVDYWDPGIFTVPNDSLHRPDYLKKYLDLQELFKDRKDFEIYFHEDANKENIAVLQRHPKAMKWEKYKIYNSNEVEEWQEKLQEEFATSSMLARYSEQIDAESNLIKIDAKDTSAEDLIKSIYHHDGTPAWKESENADIKELDTITLPRLFNKKFADKITNFSPSTDTLEINTDSFGIDSSATFAFGKNKKAVKKKLAKLDIDFLYDQKKGVLYFNENGADKGFGNGGIIAILKGAPELTARNFSNYFTKDTSSIIPNGLDNNTRTISRPSEFKIKYADKITNFSPSTDTLEINTESFGVDSSATFTIGKNKNKIKRKLAKKDFDFLYDEKKGGLYFNENGSDKGFGDGGIIAVFKGAPDLASGNLGFI